MLIVFGCIIMNTYAHKGNLHELSSLQTHCNQEKYFCKYSNRCIDIIDKCISFTYINSLLW